MPSNGLPAGDAPDQLIQRIRIAPSEVDPREESEEGRQLRLLVFRVVRQDHRDHRALAVDELLQEGLELELLPRPLAVLADEDSGGAAPPD